MWKGGAAFIALKCYNYHTVSEVQLPKPEASTNLSVALGGEVIKVRTYGEFVTAVIHPSHDIARPLTKKEFKEGKSPMPEFNSVMTVQQMIDLVAFLQAHYEKLEPEPSSYHYYP
jgi:sulfur-oxidizing protein SoxX